MARARRSGRKSYNWFGSVFGESTLTATQSVLASLDFLSNNTVVRNIGRILCLATPDAAGDGTVIGLGIIRVSDAARVAGGVAVPGPINDQSAAWLWHTYVPMFSVAATAASDVGLGLVKYVVFDTSAMRKCSSEESLVLVGELSGAAFASVQVIGGWRSLVEGSS